MKAPDFIKHWKEKRPLRGGIQMRRFLLEGGIGERSQSAVLPKSGQLLLRIALLTLCAHILGCDSSGQKKELAAAGKQEDVLPDARGRADS